ncbi:hypothetical protein N657DRAFT_666663 [Parathielavia appendiculata]|uniref:Uncharacterized protein n=1 Tax=Parathielavia appendiculata TaxID=2587402 RepID=A0AAN6YYY8_9PEZI|nr:hypothetical protein N657DRAFT_666663 [Parathielavia appendiculata]
MTDMASSSASVTYPMPPASNKRDQGAIGADLIITYYSDLAQCEILPTGSRYTTSGSFKAGTFLPFIQPAFIHDLYPRLLSTRTRKEDDWEGKWFSIVARLLPNKLTFHGVRLDGWEGEETEVVQVALALPPHVSFAGPVDLDTFHIKDGVWPEPLLKTSLFVRLGSYLQPENNRPPHKGVHICHVIVVFLVEQQPWKSLPEWMRTTASPFPRGSWIVCSGRLLGVLDRNEEGAKLSRAAQKQEVHGRKKETAAV